MMLAMKLNSYPDLGETIGLFHVVVDVDYVLQRPLALQ
jgi:hypothetical protein